MRRKRCSYACSKNLLKLTVTLIETTAEKTMLATATVAVVVAA